MEKLKSIARRIWAGWMNLQVEFHGRYSVERVSRLKTYMETATNTRVVSLCAFSAVPCLILAIMVEAVPLAPPEAGVGSNWVFLLRFGFVTGFMVGSMIFQLGRNVPALIVKTHHVLIIAVLTACSAVATLYAVATATVFPVPFSMLIASPPSIVVYGFCFVIFWGAQFKSSPEIQKEVQQQTTVLNCQLTLTLVYPMYIFGFTSFTGIYQTVFVLVLPVIKLIAKNWISFALTGHNDLKPEAVIFNVEVFNALYIANALQVASSEASTISIMVVDVLHFWVSMYDVVQVLNEVKMLMNKIPEDHPLAKLNFLQVSMCLLDYETRHMSRTMSHFADASHPTWRGQIEEWVNSKAPPITRDASSIPEDEAVSTRTLSQTLGSLRAVRIFPSRHQLRSWFSKARVSPNTRSEIVHELKHGIDTGLESIFTRDERALFIRQSASVLFITEYLVLVEYVEVVLPIVYCLHHIIVYNLHNRAYYPALDSISSTELWTTMSHVLIYCSLEFASLIVSIIILKRTLGFSSFRQLAFVLENQAGIVQGKLLLHLIYIMQISLVHIGADFSFKFPWIHSNDPSS